MKSPWALITGTSTGIGRATALRLGRDAVMAAMLKKWLPASWFEAILRREFGIS